MDQDWTYWWKRNDKQNDGQNGKPNIKQQNDGVFEKESIIVVAVKERHCNYEMMYPKHYMFAKPSKKYIESVYWDDELHGSNVKGWLQKCNYQQMTEDEYLFILKYKHRLNYEPNSNILIKEEIARKLMKEDPIKNTMFFSNIKKNMVIEKPVDLSMQHKKPVINNLQDAANYYTGIGNKNYAYLKKLIDKYKHLGLTTIYHACTGNGSVQKDVLCGSFLCTEEQYNNAVEILEFENKFFTHIKELGGRKDYLYEAIGIFYSNDRVNKAHLENRLFNKCREFTTIKDINDALEKVEYCYNFRTKNCNKVDLAHEYKIALSKKKKNGNKNNLIRN